MAAWIAVPTVASLAFVPLVANAPGGDEGLLVAAIAGILVLAFSEWLVLRGRFVGAGWWIPATTVGAGLGLVANILTGLIVWMIVAPGDPADAAFWSEPPPAALAAGLAVCGIGAPLGQWLFLRRRVRGAWTWLVAGAALSLVGVAHQLRSGPPVWPPPDLVAAALDRLTSGLVTGMVTAPILLWLLGRPTPPFGTGQKAG
jgi:hypothetical protein